MRLGEYNRKMAIIRSTESPLHEQLEAAGDFLAGGNPMNPNDMLILQGLTCTALAVLLLRTASIQQTQGKE